MSGIPTTRAVLDETHDVSLRSWVASANAPTGDFPIQNLPLGVFRRERSQERRIGVAIGDQILDLTLCEDAGVLAALPSSVRDAVKVDTLNPLMSLGPDATGQLRRGLVRFLRIDGGRPNDRLLVPMTDAQML